MALEHLPVTIRCAYLIGGVWLSNNIPRNILTGVAGGNASLLLQFNDSVGQTTLSLVVGGGREFADDIETDAQFRIVGSNGSKIWDGGLAGDTVTPYDLALDAAQAAAVRGLGSGSWIDVTISGPEQYRPLPLEVALGRPGLVGSFSGEALPLEVALGRPGLVGRLSAEALPLEVALGRPGLVGRFSGEALPLEVALGRPGLVGSFSAEALPLEVALRPASLHPGDLRGRRLGLTVALGRPGLYQGVHGQDLPLTVALGRPGLYQGVHGQDLPLTVALGRPGLVGRLLGRPLPIAVRIERPFPAPVAGDALALSVALAGRIRPRPPVVAGVPLALSVALAGRIRPRPPHIAGDALALTVALEGAIAPRPPDFDIERRATAPRYGILTAIEIVHPDSPAAVRLINDGVSRTIDGARYVRSRFDARLADDVERRAPRAEIVIGNVGRAMSQWLELTGGGAGGTARVLQVLAVDDSAIEWELTLDIAGTSADSGRVIMQLGFDPLLGRPAVAMRYDPETAPGLY